MPIVELIEDITIEYTAKNLYKGSHLELVCDNQESDYICVRFEGYNYMIKRKSVKY